MNVINRNGSLSKFALLAFIFFIPLEDFLFQDIFGSVTRLSGGIMIVLYFLTERTINFKYANVLFYIYFSWATLSILFWARNPDYYSIFRLFMWMLTTLVAANLFAKNLKLVPIVFRVYIFSCLYLGALAIRNFIANSDPTRVDVEGMDQNLLASHFLICNIYILHNIFQSKKKNLRIGTSFLLFSFFLVATIATGSRAAIITTILAFLLIIPQQKITFSNILKIGLLILFLFYFFFFDKNMFASLLASRIEASKTDKGSGRIIIWKVAVTMFIDNPVLGVGYRNFPSEFGQYINLTSFETSEWLKFGGKDRAGAHNAVLEALCELGIIGLYLFYGFQWYLIKSLKKIKSDYSTLIVTMLICINFNALFGDLANLKYFWLMIGICMGILNGKIIKSNSIKDFN